MFAQGTRLMTASVRILSTCSLDSSPALLLISNGSKILVNCGEGVQRACLEYKQKISSIDCVCLTHLSHTSIGGLPGMILTTADIASESAAAGDDKEGEDEQQRMHHGLTLMGPLGTSTFIKSLTHFMRRERFPVRVQEGPQTKLELSRKRNQGPGHAGGFSTIQSFSFQDLQKNRSKKRPHSPIPLLQQRLSYVFSTTPVPGKFLLEKAVELGVPRGPLFGKLKMGHSVTFSTNDGTEKTVESHQVVSLPSPGVAVVVLSYDTSSDDLPKEDALSSLSSVIGNNVETELVIHLTNDQAWIPHFQTHLPGAKHIFLSVSSENENAVDRTPFRTAALDARVRSHICNELYQRLISRRPPQLNEDVASNDVVVGRTMMEYIINPKPKRGFAEDDTAQDNDTNDEAEARLLAEQSGAMEASRDIVQSLDQSSLKDFCGDLVFTGTGSAVPCKHRNVTGMSLKAANGNSMLLDAGEGTIGQLLRFEKNGGDASSVIAGIKAVWISHPHADHHLGIIRLLHERRAKDPLMLIAPTPLFRFLDEYTAIDPEIRDRYVPFDCKHLVDEATNNTAANGKGHNSKVRSDALARLQETFGWTDIRTIPVAHCAHAYAVILDGTPFGRVVYSGVPSKITA